MKRFVIVCFSTLVVSSCNGPKTQEIDNYDRTLILRNVADQIIIPNYEDFQSSLESLESSKEGFLNSPTSESLQLLRNAWFDARLSWKACEAFDFGPIETMALSTSVDLFPISTSGIEESIVNYDGSENYLIALGSNKKGFATLEYLLFHDTEANVLAAFEDANHKAFLGLLIGDLLKISEMVLTGWDEYYESFVNDGGNDSGASMTLLSNEMIVLIEKIKNFKVAVPLGLLGDGTPAPEKAEAYYSEKSLELIIENLEVIKDIFTGKDGNGFDDYLNELGIADENNELLSDRIEAQIEVCIALTREFSLPLNQAVTDDRSPVEALFAQLQILTVMVKSDMMSQLGLIVTFSDNDGD
ncbi:MAG: imelysin family protein [Bacteroidota bacterium]